MSQEVSCRPHHVFHPVPLRNILVLITIATLLEHRTPSPALTLNLSSNNPFRNHASPQPSPALSTPRTTAPRPQSRNPFLSLAEQDHVLQRPKSSYAHSHFSPPLEPQRSSAFIRMPTAQEEKQAAYLERAEQLFVRLPLSPLSHKSSHLAPCNPRASSLR